MELVHTCTKYGYMQAHTSDMPEGEEIFPKNMMFGSQVSGLAKMRLGKLCHESDIHHYTHRIVHNT